MAIAKTDTTELDKIVGLTKDGKTPSEIGKELSISHQRVSAVIRKHEAENKPEQEFSPHLFAKSHNDIIDDGSMGSAVIMSAAEYHEYCTANGTYMGRKDGVKTKLNPGELRVHITLIKTGRSTAPVILKHLMDKHGIELKDVVACAHELAREEEKTTARSVMMELGVKI